MSSLCAKHVTNIATCSFVTTNHVEQRSSTWRTRDFSVQRVLRLRVQSLGGVAVTVDWTAATAHCTRLPLAAAAVAAWRNRSQLHRWRTPAQYCNIIIISESTKDWNQPKWPRQRNLFSPLMLCTQPYHVAITDRLIMDRYYNVIWLVMAVNIYYNHITISSDFYK